MKFGRDKCWVHDNSGQLRGMGRLVGKHYQLEYAVRHPFGEQASVAVNNNDLWHQRLGHMNSQELQRMVDEGHVLEIKLSSPCIYSAKVAPCARWMHAEEVSRI